MENSILDRNVHNKELELEPGAVNNLESTRKWTLFISITGFVFLGLMLILFLSVLFVQGRENFAFKFLPLILILFMSSLYFFPIYYLFQFSRNAKIAVAGRASEALSIALRFLKMHYRFMGILMIVIVGFYLIVGIIFVFTGGPARFFQPDI